MNVLFICNQNKHRSKTAEYIFKDRFNVKSAGLYNSHPVDETQLSWADLIFVMENFQRKEISERFPELYLQKQIISLDIPDIFHFNQPKLIEMLKDKIKSHLPL